QDGRPTLKINAVALREEDAKQGMAEDIDSHILTRYASLGAASLLAGYGRAYAYRPGTAVVSSGGVFTTQTTEPSNKQIIGRSLGEVGRNFSQEMRRDFNKPTTYSTPANKGFILYFMDDVYPSN
ncbi:MAG: DotG/IcmE/VirB10 family protein, partial [Methylotenera sp.]